MMKTLMHLVSGMVLCALITVTGAEAKLISVSDPNFGLVTRDTVNHLEWLDVLAALDRTFPDVSSQFGPGGDFAGWRHANAAELELLFAAAGFPVPYSSSTPTQEFAEFQQLLGCDFCPDDAFIFGLYDDTIDGVSADHGIAQVFEESIEIQPDGFPFGDIFGNVGHWLVRAAPVPEPGTLLLVGVGLVIFGAAKRHSRQA